MRIDGDDLRETGEHRQAQMAGRGGVFADYRLRVAHALMHYGLHELEASPEDRRAVHG